MFNYSPGKHGAAVIKPALWPFLMAVFLIGSMLMGACAAPAVPTSTVTASVTPTATATPTPTIPPKPANPELILASTTSTRDSGLMDVLIPIFQQKTGYVVKPIYVGSGQAMTMGEKGEADVLLVHAPASEVAFMKADNGVNRRLVMHNDYIILGPAADPAGIKGTKLAVDAMKKIADKKATFYSRGDNSGTDQLEKSLWKTAGITAKGQTWYLEANLGMGDLLRIASEKAGYTISDRATYLANQKTLSLEVLVQGDGALLNIYHVIQVNPAKWSKVNAEGAKAFSDFMVSLEAQQAISKYGIEKYGQPLFFPDVGKTEADLGSI